MSLRGGYCNGLSKLMLVPQVMLMSFTNSSSLCFEKMSHQSLSHHVSLVNDNKINDFK